MLTQEQIDAGLLAAKATVERGRKALEQSRAERAQSPLTPERLQAFMNKLSPHDRTWINSLVAGSLAEIQKQLGTAQSAPRKPRSLV